MNQYNPNAACPKCGNDKLTSSFKRACKDHIPDLEREYGDHDVESPFNILSEHIVRHCTNCHFEWPELPLDARIGPTTCRTEDAT